MAFFVATSLTTPVNVILPSVPQLAPAAAACAAREPVVALPEPEHRERQKDCDDEIPKIESAPVVWRSH
jgi:hypothetical protein